MEADKIDEYRVLGDLGKGSYGETFEVEAPSGERYALKWRHEHPADAEKARFQIEAWALQQLDHPNIPKFVETGERQKRPYIVMTLAPGEALQSAYDRQINEGGFMHELSVLQIVEKILDALEHMHAKGIIHRDIKLANVISTVGGTRVAVIDLGVCKSDDQPVDVATFWPVGAGKYSPPFKIEHPNQPHPSHDVFAVGVIAYALMTSKFPWDFQPEEDVGVLKKRMVEEAPSPIRTLNPAVRKEVADFLASLLVIEDHKRPSATEALTTARTLIEVGRSRNVELSRSGLKYPRVIRDAVHGDILATEYEWELINTPEFQRLRWIRQLGTSHLVYPGAEHTRFSHAIGTMHVAGKILERMGQTSDEYFEPEETQMARIYALLHDVTHIAYGHTLEDELALYDRHDKNDKRIKRLLLSSKSGLNRVLSKTEYGRIVLDHFDSSATIGKKSWLLELVESPSGADVIDYVDRDSLFCGLDHRIDSAIYRRFKIDRSDSTNEERRHLLYRLHSKRGFRLDAEFALESILLERLALFMKVFTHQTKTAASSMIGKAVWQVESDYRRAGKVGQLEREIEWMGDSDLLLFLKNAGNPIAKSLIEGVNRRELFKPYYRARVIPNDSDLVENAYRMRQKELASKPLDLFNAESRDILEAQIATKCGLKPHEVIIYCSPSAPGFKRIMQQVQQEERGKREERKGLEEHRAIQRGHLKLWKILVFAPPNLDHNAMQAIADEAYEIFGLKNELPYTAGKQMLLF